MSRLAWLRYIATHECSRKFPSRNPDLLAKPLCHSLGGRQRRRKQGERECTERQRDRETERQRGREVERQGQCRVSRILERHRHRRDLKGFARERESERRSRDVGTTERQAERGEGYGERNREAPRIDFVPNMIEHVVVGLGG